MKVTTAKLDKETTRWTLSWQPDGRCDRFTREAILACAPPTSGVYGLFNFDCQVFIGESTNIQAALLLHESETDFQSRHLRPTGFTFEPCAAELRKSKAAELIARFRPVLQDNSALNQTWSPVHVPLTSDVGLGAQEFENDAHPQEFPAHERETSPQIRRRCYFTLRQSALAAVLATSVAVISYLGLPGDYAIPKRANGGNPSSAEGETSLMPQSASSIRAAAAGIASQSADPAPAKPEVNTSDPTSNGAVRLAAKSVSPKDETAVREHSERAKSTPISPSAKSAESTTQWSVQIAAAPAKDVADNLVQRLKANGYEGYVVQTEVNGRTYYRVRIGRFGTRQEAESVRQSLARQESYREAYLTHD
ncbi:MAG: SPOR domain-containing protein [Chloroflexota bacterium]